MTNANDSASAAIPYGYCQCGCGEKTKPAPYTKASRGWVKGEPIRFIREHIFRVHGPQANRKSYTVEDYGYESPCWIWQGTLTEKGYARAMFNGRLQRVHRFFYENEHGPIPEGLQLDHLCRVRSCVNPRHLEPVTCAENIRRGHAARKG